MMTSYARISMSGWHKRMGRKAEATKANILAIAITEFSERGFDGARINVIAEKAKINKERIYAYFESKEGLYTAVVDETYGRVVTAEEPLSALTENDAERMTERIISLYFDFHRAHPEFSRILVWENLGGGGYAKDFGTRRKKIFGHLAAIYDAGRRRGVFKNDVSFESYIFTLTAVSFFYFSNLRTMSRTLSLNLSDTDVTGRIVRECIALLSRSGGD